MILENDGVTFNITKEKVKSLALKAKVTRQQTSDDSDSQEGCDEDAAKAQDKSEVVTTARKEVTSLVSVQSPRRKRLLSEELEVILKTIVDSGCTKHMNGYRRLFTSYKEYDSGHVVFGSNLKGKVISGGNISLDSITIINLEHVSGLAFNLISVGHLCDDDCIVSFTKVDCTIIINGRMLAKGHRINGLYTYKIGDDSKQQICLASMVDNSTLWHGKLGHTNMRIEESLNVNFDESLPKPKSVPLVEVQNINELIVQDLHGSSSLEVNVSNEGYPKSVKEARGHQIEQVIGELNERTLRSKTKQA
ncbi:hypothetical protein Tco_0531491 [Tanacetum coccineum]